MVVELVGAGLMTGLLLVGCYGNELKNKGKQ
jgi:hypothetical protein